MALCLEGRVACSVERWKGKKMVTKPLPRTQLARAVGVKESVVSFYESQAGER